MITYKASSNYIRYDSVAEANKYFFKLLDKNRTGGFSDWKWPELGEWTPQIDQLSPCHRGYHVLLGRHIHTWNFNFNRKYQTLAIVEVDPTNMLVECEKFVVRKARIVYEIPIPHNFPAGWYNLEALLSEHNIALYHATALRYNVVRC